MDRRQEVEADRCQEVEVDRRRSNLLLSQRNLRPPQVPLPRRRYAAMRRYHQHPRRTWLLLLFSSTDYPGRRCVVYAPCFFFDNSPLSRTCRSKVNPLTSGHDTTTLIITPAPLWVSQPSPCLFGSLLPWYGVAALFLFGTGND